MASKMISREEWDRIKRNFRFFTEDEFRSLPVEFHVQGTWKRVYCEGSDSKYGTIMVSTSVLAWRHPTFDEFYAGAVID